MKTLLAPQSDFWVKNEDGARFIRHPVYIRYTQFDVSIM